ncbi:thioredoxin family protein [Pontibacter sp. G13]|uniref:thioredoxin family protein n=1 Tax=Pontibacter sp. G13 TaxID=3074898 RepID=UPI0028894230|nr:thioredoxin family protein [Pontibacter sp. G13]WNJ20553.1 thioredoxin family protein [Pontibacter sp. G13]
MSRIFSYVSTFTVMLFMATAVSAQGMEFFHGSLEEAQAKAKEEGKLVFVDAYATWCGPCKQMAKEVFPETSVGDYYNEHYICLKLDVDQAEGAAFAKKYGIKFIPNFFYLDASGEVLLEKSGYYRPSDFVKLGEKARKKA